MGGKYTGKGKTAVTPKGFQRNTGFPYGDAPGRLDGLSTSTAIQMTPGLSFGGAPAVVPSAWDKTFGQSFDPRPSVGAAAAGAKYLRMVRHCLMLLVRQDIWIPQVY